MNLVATEILDDIELNGFTHKIILQGMNAVKDILLCVCLKRYFLCLETAGVSIS